MKVLSIIGGRPHLIKAEAVHTDLLASGLTHLSIRAGVADNSDYPDEADFDLPVPTRRVFVDDAEALAVGMADALRSIRADVILLYGDLIATHFALPAALASGIRVAHIESGYRSHDLSDLEERTRILCDHAAAFRFAYTDGMVGNLLAEGIGRASIGVILDPARVTLLRHLGSDVGRVADVNAPGVVTLHRDETVHNPQHLGRVIHGIEELSAKYPLHVILYRRTERHLSEYGLLKKLEANSRITTTSTLPYDRYVEVLRRAPFVVTDSSGLQDDCMTLGLPCVVVRQATSRPLAHNFRLASRVTDDRWSLLALVDEVLGASANRRAEPPEPPDASGLGRLHIAEALAGIAS